jgi:branched-chain amino acid transport system permease protein
MVSLYVNVLVGGMLIGAVYALVALGLTIMFGVMKIVNFAHGELVVLGMYLGYLLWSGFGLAPLMAMPIAALIMFCLGYLLQRFLVNRFIRSAHHSQFILFIALGLILTGAHLMIFGPDPRTISTPANFEVVNLGAIRLDLVRLQAAAAALVMIALLLACLRYSRMGASIRAAADNQVGAQAIGLRVERLYAVTAGLGLACAGAAGALIAPIFDVQPFLAPEFTMAAFVIVIIGGLGSMAGALVGGLVIGISESLAALLIDPSMKSMISYGVLVLMLLFKPQGLFGGKS